MVDNLVTYIKKEDFKDFTIKDSERRILLYETFNFKDFTIKVKRY